MDTNVTKTPRTDALAAEHTDSHTMVVRVLDLSRQLEEELFDLKHDMERGMANHNADINAAHPEAAYTEIGYLLKNEYGFISAHVSDLLSVGQTPVYRREPQPSA